MTSRGTHRRSIRVDDETWRTFGLNAAITGKDRTAVLLALMAWFNGEPDAQLPQRPEPDAQ